MLAKYPNALAVTLNAATNQMDPTNAVDYTGYVVFSGNVSPTEDVQALAQALLLDSRAVQSAVDGNRAMGQDASVDHVSSGGTGGVDPFASAVALPAFTIVVNTRNDTDPVDQAQLTKTFQDYLAGGIMEEFPSVVAVALVGSPSQMDPSNAVDYTGHAVFSGTSPPTEDVQALAEELLLDLTAIQAAVDAADVSAGWDSPWNPRSSVDQVAVDGIGGQAGPSSSALTLSDYFALFLNSSKNKRDYYYYVDRAQLTKTLEDYLVAGIMQDYPNAVAVALIGSKWLSVDGIINVDYTGHVVFSGMAPPPRDWQAFVQEFLLDRAAMQAAVDGNAAIGQNVQVSQVSVGGISIVLLPDFTLVTTSDDINAVNQAELTRTLEDYLIAGLKEYFHRDPVETAVLQPQQSQQFTTIFFSGYARFAGSTPYFGEFSVQWATRRLLSDTRAVQTALDSNPAIGGNVRVDGVVFERSFGRDNDYNYTSKIVGGVVGASAVCLALLAIFRVRGRSNPENDADVDHDEGSPLAYTPPLLPSVVVS